MRLLQTTNYKLPTCLPAGKARRKAFTLIEILIVCTIIALLAAVVIVNLEKAQAKSRDVQRKADLSLIAAAVESYKVDTKSYPVHPFPIPSPAGAGIEATATSMAELATYLPMFPKDPKRDSDSSYIYSYRGEPGEFKLAAKSETIIIPSDDTCADIIDDAKRLAGDFYNPSTIFCTWFQISSSINARQNW